MSSRSIRKLLTISGLSIIPLAGIFGTLTAYAPFMGYPLGSEIKIIASQLIAAFLSPVSLAVLCLWAAHNLKPLSFMKTETLRSLCSIGIICNILIFLVALVEVAMTASIYENAFGYVLSTASYSVSTFLYGVTSIALLFFAKLQLTKLGSGDKLQPNIYEETFS